MYTKATATDSNQLKQHNTIHSKLYSKTPENIHPANHIAIYKLPQLYLLSTARLLRPPPPPPPREEALACAACAAKMRSWAGTRSPSSSISYSTSTRALLDLAAGTRLLALAEEEEDALGASKASLRFLEASK